MNRLFVLFGALGFSTLGCSSPPDDDSEGTTSEQALRVGYVEVAGHWERAVACDGAHFDRVRTDDSSSYMDKIYWQLVITDPGAVSYQARAPTRSIRISTSEATKRASPSIASSRSSIEAMAIGARPTT